MPESMEIDDYMKHLGLKVDGKKSKYRNKPFRDEHGAYWHSKGEHSRWRILGLLSEAGEIQCLERQKTYVLGQAIDTKRPVKMVWDFYYTISGVEYVEDWKGFTVETKGGTRKSSEAWYTFKIKASWFHEKHPDVRIRVSSNNGVRDLAGERTVT